MRRTFSCLSENATLVQWSQKPPTSVSFSALFKAGSVNTEIDGGQQRLWNATFLHHELRVRTAQRAVELGSLPLGLSERKHIVRVRNYYERIFDRLDSLPPPLTLEDDRAFTQNLETIVLSGHSDVIHHIARGVTEMRKDLGEDFTDDVRLLLDLHLNRFFIARIGLRFLIEHHIASLEPAEGFSGMIATACSPLQVIQHSANHAADTCR
jgi:pyruvate dehydrogenase kinase 2/3/4